MNHLNSDFTDTDIAALWPDLFEGTAGSSNMSAPQAVHEDSTTSYPSSADTGYINFNVGNESVLTSTTTVPALPMPPDWGLQHPM